MKRYLNVPSLLLFVLALSCAAPEPPSGHLGPDKTSTPMATTAPAETPFPTATPATPHDPALRGGSVRLANGRTAPIIRIVPRDHISAVFDPVHVPAADVGEQVGTASSVIGVSIRGESVAYSVSYLSGREIVNDTVGGTPIVVTW